MRRTRSRRTGLGLGRAIGDLVRIGVVHYPFRSNFTDFDPFFHEPGVEVRYITDPALLEACHVICLPGTKQTMADLDWLRQHGFDKAFASVCKRGRFWWGCAAAIRCSASVWRIPMGLSLPCCQRLRARILTDRHAVQSG